MSNIKIDPNNYRIHDDKNKRLIRKSLEECGAGRSILFDNDDCIIAGNGVYEQAQELGLKVRVIESDGTELIAIKRNDLSTEDARRKALALADNHILDSWDIDFSSATINMENQDADIPDELTAERKVALPFVKISFQSVKQFERFEVGLKELIEKFEGITYVVGGGEL